MGFNTPVANAKLAVGGGGWGRGRICRGEHISGLERCWIRHKNDQGGKGGSGDSGSGGLLDMMVECGFDEVIR